MPYIHMTDIKICPEFLLPCNFQFRNELKKKTEKSRIMNWDESDYGEYVHCTRIYSPAIIFLQLFDEYTDTNFVFECNNIKCRNMAKLLTIYSTEISSFRQLDLI